MDENGLKLGIQSAWERRPGAIKTVREREKIFTRKLRLRQ